MAAAVRSAVEASPTEVDSGPSLADFVLWAARAELGLQELTLVWLCAASGPFLFLAPAAARNTALNKAESFFR